MALLRGITLVLIKVHHKRVVGTFGADWINCGNTEMGLKTREVGPIRSSCLFLFPLVLASTCLVDTTDWLEL